MHRRLRHCLLSVLLPLTLSVAVAAPAAAQTGAGPPGDTSGFEAIDGTTLRPATLSYDATMNAGGRSLDLSSTLTVAATATGGTDTWTFVNTIDTPRGTSRDSLVADRASLLPLSRHQIGPSTLDLTYTGPSAADRAASGTMNVSGERTMGDRSVSIDTRLDGPTLAGGIHDVLALGAMPLSPGFRAALRVFSPQDQATKRAEFAVTGTETVETPAGSFETYAVDLNVGDGYVTGTVHLRKEAPHYYVKWRTEVNAARGSRTIVQTLSSMDLSTPTR